MYSGIYGLGEMIVLKNSWFNACIDAIDIEETLAVA